jgi:phospho-N-acetylmuramoyl-pentapeptide-transferase
LCFGAIGFIDDYFKIKAVSTKGISGKLRFGIQLLLGLIFAFVTVKCDNSNQASHVIFPFWPNLSWNLSFFYLIFASYVISGTANAVNITDGLDGLATVPIILVLGCLAGLAYSTDCDDGSYIKNTVTYSSFTNSYARSEILVFCAALSGSSLGFLWFNAKPARIFMGDIGSLALGSAIGGISVILKQELLLLVVGGLFVIETLSVILQVLYFKWTGGQRLFLMAPLHHHFEKKGWPETLIVTRFWIISTFFVFLGILGIFLKILVTQMYLKS